MANLTSKQIKKWQTDVNDAISNKLLKNVNRIAGHAQYLSSITGSADKSLSRQYNDLNTLALQVASKTKSFMTKFSTALGQYIKDTETQEAAIREKNAKAKDDFAEVADAISKL